MPFQRLLDGLLRDVAGTHGALLLDAEGEVAVQAGAGDERHRLIGAYQGIALALARRATDRYAQGEIRYIACRYEGAQVLLRPLRDGYYLVVSLDSSASLALAVERSAELQGRLDEEI